MTNDELRISIAAMAEEMAKGCLADAIAGLEAAGLLTDAKLACKMLDVPEASLVASRLSLAVMLQEREAAKA